MTLTTVPLTQQTIFSHHDNRQSDEHGTSLPKVSDILSQEEWNAGIVHSNNPTLEQENQKLNLHIEASNFTSRPRPIPRWNGYDEIIQDGLGSDELIPAEWATGSQAQFTTQSLSPGTAHRLQADLSRSPRRSRSFFSASEDRPRLLSDSSEAHGNHSDSPIDVLHDTQSGTSPSINAQSGSLGLEQARERARKLARARQASSQSILGDGASKANETTRQQDDQEVLDTENVIPDQTLKRQKSNVSHKSGSKISLGDSTASPSRIPKLMTNASPRSPGHTDQENAKGLRTNKSYDNLNSTRSRTRSNEKPHVTTPKGSSSAKSRKGSKTPEVSTPTRPSRQARPPPRSTNVQSPPISQAVLDEFGPLGGSPNVPSSKMDEFGASRTSSNPWDEEIVPTVKRRLAQQQLLQSATYDTDEYIDLWDRDGLPLSKSQHSVKSHNSGGKREERGQDANMTEKVPGVEEKEKSETRDALQSPDGATQNHPHKTSPGATTRPAPISSPKATLQESIHPYPPSVGQSHARAPEQEDIGCCKCIIM